MTTTRSITLLIRIRLITTLALVDNTHYGDLRMPKKETSQERHARRKRARPGATGTIEDEFLSPENGFIAPFADDSICALSHSAAEAIASIADMYRRIVEEGGENCGAAVEIRETIYAFLADDAR